MKADEPQAGQRHEHLERKWECYIFSDECSFIYSHNIHTSLVVILSIIEISEDGRKVFISVDVFTFCSFDFLCFCTLIRNAMNYVFINMQLCLLVCSAKRVKAFIDVQVSGIQCLISVLFKTLLKMRKNNKSIQTSVFLPK